jgi:transcriptional regulator with XRE-family HTH domain
MAFAHLSGVDDLRFGAIVRTVRRRRGLRQADVAVAAGVGQWAISAVERGRLDRLPLGTIRSVCAALEIRCPMAPRWRGVELPRLADSRHAALVESVVARLTALKWECVVEYTFQHFGERGSVDVLAWRAAARALLIVEVKTDLDDLQDMFAAIDRKVRLVPRLVADERGWRAASVGMVLVMRESSTSRYQVGRHPALFAAALPGRNLEVRHWLAKPGGRPLRGVWFLQSSDGVTAMEDAGTGGGSRRIRVPHLAASAAAAGGRKGRI